MIFFNHNSKKLLLFSATADDTTTDSSDDTTTEASGDDSTTASDMESTTTSADDTTTASADDTTTIGDDTTTPEAPIEFPTTTDPDSELLPDDLGNNKIITEIFQ